MVLEIKKISKNFGGIQALTDVSFSIEARGSTWFDWAEWCWENNNVQYDYRYVSS